MGPGPRALSFPGSGAPTCVSALSQEGLDPTLMASWGCWVPGPGLLPHPLNLAEAGRVLWTCPPYLSQWVEFQAQRPFGNALQLKMHLIMKGGKAGAGAEHEQGAREEEPCICPAARGSQMPVACDPRESRNTDLAVTLRRPLACLRCNRACFVGRWPCQPALAMQMLRK